MKINKIIKINMFLLLIIIMITALPISAKAALSDGLAGRILLQVQERGEAWFVHPTNHKRYYLGNPSLMLQSMQKLGVGVKNDDIKGIPIGLIETEYQAADTDSDGLADDLEIAINTDINNKDTDGDGFDDYTEVKNGYNPLGEGRSNLSPISKGLAGNILLQVEKNGEAWYWNPIDGKRYFLGRPEQALEVVRKFGLGITNADLNEIASNEEVTLDPILKDCGKAEFLATEEIPDGAPNIENSLKATRCFYENFKTCSASKLQITMFGNDYIYEIIGPDGDKCQIKQYYISINPQIGSLLNEDFKSLLDKSMVCTYNQDRGGYFFEELSKGNITYKSNDPAYEKCEGDLADGLLLTNTDL